VRLCDLSSLIDQTKDAPEGQAEKLYDSDITPGYPSKPFVQKKGPIAYVTLIGPRVLTREYDTGKFADGVRGRRGTDDESWHHPRCEQVHMHSSPRLYHELPNFTGIQARIHSLGLAVSHRVENLGKPGIGGRSTAFALGGVGDRQGRRSGSLGDGKFGQRSQWEVRPPAEVRTASAPGREGRAFS